MAYRIKPTESIAKSLPRITLEQISLASRVLTQGPDANVAVHEARKSLKRVRALLSLTRPMLGEKLYKRENRRYRDIARGLAGARDRFVLGETLEKLERHYGTSYGDGLIGRARKALVGDARDGAVSPEMIKRAVGALGLANANWSSIRFRRISIRELLQGLEASYRSARQNLKLARETDVDHAFHELRKDVQQHWRHMQLLSRAWPELIDVRIASARDISLLLGDDHDLYVLLQHLEAGAEVALSDEDRRALRRLCRRRQQELRRSAVPLAQRLFADRPSAFVHGIEASWKAAADLVRVSASRGRRQEGPVLLARSGSVVPFVPRRSDE
ncbi:MAG: CHAD domain-containing protein [Hyphomicrobiaceae bacterium]|nr:CHAD domain-containing protein [Hyphomicrobiaceae bacterium]